MAQPNDQVATLVSEQSAILQTRLNQYLDQLHEAVLGQSRHQHQPEILQRYQEIEATYRSLIFSLMCVAVADGIYFTRSPAAPE